MNQIRNNELQRIKSLKFYQWVDHYKEPLYDLYDIFKKYHPISYENFLFFAYECTLEHYDYESKSYKKFLI